MGDKANERIISKEGLPEHSQLVTLTIVIHGMNGIYANIGHPFIN